MYTLKDCTDENVYNSDLQGRFVILKEDFFKPEYQSEKYQLVLCTGGFGCNPTEGNFIFVTEINSNPKSYKIKRDDKDILGFAKDSIVRAHKEKYCKVVASI